ncbi:MAG: class II aldolase/adducin family protein [Elusimicrobia bacterium]|nr:class II aldolase/adducin family protein [Elusimicrobiota bacterium]
MDACACAFRRCLRDQAGGLTRSEPRPPPMPKHDTRQFANQHERRKIAVAPEILRTINSLKARLLSQRLLGTLEQGPFAGYDYGNLSIRSSRQPLQLLITGRQTASKQPLTADDFALVHGYRAEDFVVLSRGRTEPSSETPLHWRAFQADARVGAVAHAHVVDYHPLAAAFPAFLKESGLRVAQLRSKSRAGAEEIGRLVAAGGLGIILMPNHDGGFGVFSTGADIVAAVASVAAFYQDLERYGEAHGIPTG